ncbi:MAG TPA: HDOD domain-containing protein [Planctomycetota bacterium]|nr:HDOD domain-containing protein [Planctomycetota bacterium]
MDELQELVERTLEIPSVPRVYVQIEEVMNRPDSSMSEVVKILEGDPGLAVRCLRVANSALYARRQPCSSIKQAVTLLGVRTLRDIALHASLVVAYQGVARYERFDLQRFWKHGAATGHVARQLTALPGFRGVTPDTAAVCGLVHNIGRLTMLDAFRNPYLDVIVPCGSRGHASLQAEGEAFGFDHAVVGGVLAEKWNLSPELVAATRDHHRSTKEQAPVANLVAIAGEVAHAMLETGIDGAKRRLSAPDVAAAGMTPARVEAIAESLAGAAATSGV